MTTKITVNVPVGHGWKVRAKLATRIYSEPGKPTDDWTTIEDSEVLPGQQRDFWLSSDTRADFEELLVS